MAGEPLFSLRRCFTALLASGDRKLLDDVLLNVNFPLWKLRAVMSSHDANAVFAAFVPDLPRPDVCADLKAQEWMVRMMRHKYGINRLSIGIGRE